MKARSRSASSPLRRFRTSLVVIAASLVGSAVLEPAGASCFLPSQFSQTNDGWSLSVPIYTYIVSPGAGTAASLLGAFWGLGQGDPNGNPGGTDNGSLGPQTPDQASGSTWLRQGGRGAYLAGEWTADQRIDGCIHNPPNSQPAKMVIAVSDQDLLGTHGFFAVACVRENISANFDFTDVGRDIELYPIPSPHVVRATRTSPDHVEVELASPLAAEIMPGVYTSADCAAASLVTGYRAYFTRAMIITPPGSPSPPQTMAPCDRRRTSGGWTPAGPPVPLGTNTTFTVTCKTGCVLYVAISLVFDSGFETDHVSMNVILVPQPPWGSFGPVKSLQAE